MKESTFNEIKKLHRKGIVDDFTTFVTRGDFDRTIGYIESKIDIIRDELCDIKIPELSNAKDKLDELSLKLYEIVWGERK